MLLESIGLGRSHHRESRHALSRLSSHQGATSGCYDIRHEKNGVHWEGCPNYNPHPRQLTTRDQLSIGRMGSSGRAIPRLGDPTSSMGLPLLQRNHSSPSERYMEGSGGMEALAMGGMGPRPRNIGQNPGGLEALRLGGHDPRGRNSNLDGTLPTGLEHVEGLGDRRLPSPLRSDQYAAFEPLMNRNMTPRSSHRGLPIPSRQYPLQDDYPFPRMRNPPSHDSRIPISPMQFQDLRPGPPEFATAPQHAPPIYYRPNSPRPSHRSTPRMMYNEIAQNPHPHPHHPSHQQSPNPLIYGEMDSPLTSSRYGSIHSPQTSHAGLRRSMGIEQAMMPYTTHGYAGTRNAGSAHAARLHLDTDNLTNYQSPYVEDWVSEGGMGVQGQDEMMQRQAVMDGGGFRYDERASIPMEGDAYARSRLV
ncbi:hypothetical protein SBOR_5805 [Sclerotinia borealis F-4128]|uniref:Uncharacterized protein n=1 Tax=Sclerotinia borealis (strain F-4128) TaxID=1432307 RepID=W9CH32_SCLBF|nr:hypothetical protein SBOR_5805 [Sclerotinia borealis F-4128]